ncbi:MAG: YeeE/YedE thiosulfate transporter family protein [Thermoguttaceae bacterium]
MKARSLSQSTDLPARNDPQGLWNPYAGGVALGIVLFGAFFITGSGLGGSAGFARVAAMVQSTLLPGSADRSAYLAPMAGGGRNPLDSSLVWMTLGVVAGGFVSGWLAGRVKVETFKGPGIGKRARWGLALAGGTLMGIGARFARGCTSGQALSGGAVLSVGSWVFMIMVFAGAYALAYPLRKLWN